MERIRWSSAFSLFIFLTMRVVLSNGVPNPQCFQLVQAAV
jgi:hypothetical protein